MVEKHLYYIPEEGDVYVATSLEEAIALAIDDYSGADHPEDYQENIRGMQQYPDDKLWPVVGGGSLTSNFIAAHHQPGIYTGVIQAPVVAVRTK